MWDDDPEADEPTVLNSDAGRRPSEAPPDEPCSRAEVGSLVDAVVGEMVSVYGEADGTWQTPTAPMPAVAAGPANELPAPSPVPSTSAPFFVPVAPPPGHAIVQHWGTQVAPYDASQAARAKSDRALLAQVLVGAVAFSALVACVVALLF